LCAVSSIKRRISEIIGKCERQAQPSEVWLDHTITASFQKKQLSSVSNSSDSGIKLKVMGVGCSTCGFEVFSLGAANVAGNKSGFVQLGSSNGIDAQAGDSAWHCTAIINGPSGSEAARTSLLRTSGDKYVGIWNAEVAPGIYKVSIAATAFDVEEIFADIITIEVKA
jgi:hypothetical protein